MNCPVCYELKSDIEFAARRLAQEEQASQSAGAGFAGIAARKRIEDAEVRLRQATRRLDEHRESCPCT